MIQGTLIRRVIGRAALAAVLGGSLVVTTVQSADAPADSMGSTEGVHAAYTGPSEQRGLTFNVPGVVQTIYVKEGESVKKGQKLAEQDASIEKAHLATVEIQANSELEIAANKAAWEEKKVELQKKKNMEKTKVIGGLEVLQAELEVTVAEARYNLSIEQKQQKVLEAAEEKAKIAQRALFATTDGIVQKIGVHEGELASNDPKTPVITVVTNEPLYVEADLPVREVKMLTLKQKVSVRYADDQKWQSAETVFFNPVADPRAGTQRVRFQLDNPDKFRAGYIVYVKVGDKVASAAAAR